MPITEEQILGLGQEFYNFTHYDCVDYFKSNKCNYDIELRPDGQAILYLEDAKPLLETYSIEELKEKLKG